MKFLVLPVLVALALASVLSGLPPAAAALADDAATAPVTLQPEPTLAPTIALPTVAPTIASTVAPTALPTVLPEGPTPESTVVSTVAVPTPAPEPTYTAVVESTVRPTATAVAPESTATTQAPLAATPILAPWPSAAQLRQDAQLRWGNGIPDSVRRWAFLIVPAARQYHLDPNLIAAVMTMESNGDPLAESGADARGLMQILHGPWDPKENVYTGAHMLADLYAEFGDWSLALAGYNAGPGAVEAAGGVPPIRETHDYVIVVEYLWDLYGHHHLTVARKQQYRKTLGDLSQMKDQRHKVQHLAHIAHVTDLTLDTCAMGACLGARTPAVSVVQDPFWPVSGNPDPLQQVGPVQSGRPPSPNAVPR